MEKDTRRSLRQLVLLARKREEASAGWYGDYLKTGPKEGIKKLSRSIIDQKGKHLAAIDEWLGDLEEAVAEGSIDTAALKMRKPPLYAPPPKPTDFLLFLAESEEWLMDYYRLVADLCQDQDARFFLGNLSEEQRKYATWARDFYELECLA